MFGLFRKTPPARSILLPDKDNIKWYWQTPWPLQRKDDVLWVGLFPENAKSFSHAYSVGRILVHLDEPITGVWFISELLVIPSVRRTGLATKLLDSLIEYATSQGARYLIGRATSIPGSQPDPNFDLIGWYVRKGFKHEMLQEAEGALHNIVMRLPRK